MKKKGKRRVQNRRRAKDLTECDGDGEAWLWGKAKRPQTQRRHTERDHNSLGAKKNTRGWGRIELFLLSFLLKKGLKTKGNALNITLIKIKYYPKQIKNMADNHIDHIFAYISSRPCVFHNFQSPIVTVALG